MSESEVTKARHRLGLSRGELALLLGYVGTDRNNDTRVRRLESEEEPHLLVLRFLWLVERWREEHSGDLPAWPEHMKIEGETEPWM